jgi:hypothetical protein
MAMAEEKDLSAQGLPSLSSISSPHENRLRISSFDMSNQEEQVIWHKLPVRLPRLAVFATETLSSAAFASAVRW